MAEPVAVKLSDESIKALTDNFTKSVAHGLSQGMSDIITAPMRKLAGLMPETAGALKKVFAEAAKPMLTAAKEWVVSFDKTISSKLWKEGPPSIEKLLGGKQALGGKAVFGPGFAGASPAAADDAKSIAAPGAPTGVLTQLGKMIGPIGLAAGAVVGLGIAAVSAVKAIYSMAEQTIEAKRNLAELSTGMAAVFASRDVQEELRGMRQGEAQAGSLQDLMESEQRFKDALEPMQNLVANIKNHLLAGLLDIASSGLETLNKLLKPVMEMAKMLGVMTEEEDLPETMIEWSYRVAKETEAERKNLDPRAVRFQF